MISPTDTVAVSLILTWFVPAVKLNAQQGLPNATLKSRKAMTVLMLPPYLWMRASGREVRGNAATTILAWRAIGDKHRRSIDNNCTFSAFVLGDKGTAREAGAACLFAPAVKDPAVIA